MKVLEKTDRQLSAGSCEDEGIVQFPVGILGFEQNTRYRFFASPAEAPFLWLQMLDEPKVSFIVISPFYAMPTYQPELRDEDVVFLALESEEDALLFNVVTVRGNKATVNLKGPIVVNRRTGVAKQVIPVNAANYDLNHPLMTAVD